VALVAFNAWWLVRELRPVPDILQVRASGAAGRTAEAEGAARALLRRHPYDGAARMELARLLLGRGELIAGAEELDRVPYWWPTKGEALFLAGEAYHRAGLARRAEAAWAACALDDPLHPIAERYYLTAVESLIGMYAIQERWDEARAQAWSCLDRVAPDQRLNVVFMLLRTRVQRVAPEARAPELRRFVGADPADLASRRALARAEHALGNVEEAHRQNSTCRAQAPEDPIAWRDRLSMLYESGDTEGLAAAVAELPETTEKDAEVWKYRGHAARAAGDAGRAAECFGRAVELAPHDEQAYYQLALAQRQLGRRAEAEANLARYKEIGAARGAILAAYEEFAQAHSAKPPDPARVRTATVELSGLCRTLGWTRLADLLAPGGQPA
jgi:tetratricopeptide (TPR) repeat protein